jgi:hypothetical protein
MQMLASATAERDNGSIPSLRAEGEAIQLTRAGLDCFAALAMTVGVPFVTARE